MVGYYPNSNGKQRGSNLNKNTNTYWLFINIYGGLHILQQANIQIKHTQTQTYTNTKSIHSHIYTPTDN